MSLFIPYEQLWDRPVGGRSTQDEIPHWLGNLLSALVAFAFKIAFRYRVDGRQNLRGFYRKSGVVLVANHTSFLDVMFMHIAARPQQWVRFMARDTLFDNGGGVLGHIISRVGAFPVKRDTADRTSIKRAVAHLKNDEVIGILPEGTRRGKGTKNPELHSGAAFIARMAKVPILPMTVRNCELVKQKGKRVRFPRITLEYGQPILLSDFDFLPKEDRLDGCTWYAMRECFALSERVPREQVDMPALFPTGRDFTAVFAEHPIPEHTTEEVAARIEQARAAKEAAAARKAAASGGAGSAGDGDAADGKAAAPDGAAGDGGSR